MESGLRVSSSDEPATGTGPPFDPELAAALPAVHAFHPTTIRPDDLARVRVQIADAMPSVEDVIGDRPIDRSDHEIPGPPGAPAVTVSVLRPRGPAAAPAPAIYYTHGGGMIFGDRFTGAAELCEWVLEFGAVGVTVEYRLAPEHPAPAAVEDAYAGLLWTAARASVLGVDPGRLVLAGASAGGGLAAGLALLARDRGGPAVAGQMLLCPMLDDRDTTVSAAQFDGLGIWDRTSNRTAWDMLLPGGRGGPDVSPYVAPARAMDLSGLPAAFVDVSAAETFRDEDVAYASALWRAGVSAELHVWPGAFHRADALVPYAALSCRIRAARAEWLRRLLG